MLTTDTVYFNISLIPTTSPRFEPGMAEKMLSVTPELLLTPCPTCDHKRISGTYGDMIVAICLHCPAIHAVGDEPEVMEEMLDELGVDHIRVPGGLWKDGELTKPIFNEEDLN